MDEILWKLQQESRELQEFRQEIASGWDDDAARELNGRYFGPHENDAGLLQTSLITQRAHLEELDKQLELAAEKLRIADELTDEVEEMQLVCQKELERVYDLHERATESRGAAEELIVVVHQLINQAEKTCAKE